MKKILVFIFALASAFCFGQLQKGNILLGGSLSISSSNSDSDYTNGNTSKTKSFSMEIYPRTGFFISDQSVIGLSLGYGFSNNKNTPSINSKNNSKYSSFSISPFYRYYFPLGEKVALYIEAYASVGFGDRKPENIYYDPVLDYGTTTRSKSDVSSQSIGLQPGLAIFITPKLSVEASLLSLSYNHSKEKGDTYVTKGGSFYAQYNTFSLGFSWYLSK